MRASPPELPQSFSSRVSAAPSFGAEQNNAHASRIIECRNELVSILQLPEEISGCGNWNIIRREIYARLEQDLCSHVRKAAESLVEKIMDIEEDLIEGNMRFVLMLVRRYSREGMGAMEEMDFIQEGCEGLLDAVRRFDFSGRGSFLSYALLRIRKRVLLAMERQQRLVRIPAHVLRKGFYLREVISDFSNRHGRYPTPEEVDRETDGCISRSMILNLTETVLPLHGTTDGSGIPLEEKIPADEYKNDSELSEAVQEALTHLDSRSRFILVMHYGLADGETASLSEIGQVLGISYERVRQIEKASIAILAEHFSGFTVTDWLREE
ncbi:hypothetical protein CSA37_03055 [Candidatus Fermentibacteria bacterium]|nr:MAG: hypothetical protein CSA37_03055 [Candidatus Fermentibacteria bacterium]